MVDGHRTVNPVHQKLSGFESLPPHQTIFKDIRYKCGVYIKTRCQGNDVVH